MREKSKQQYEVPEELFRALSYLEPERAQIALASLGGARSASAARAAQLHGDEMNGLDGEIAPNGADDLNAFFLALSSATRRTILRLLEFHERSVGEIAGEVDVSQPTVSRHLSVLKSARLVTRRREGPYVLYRLDGPSMAQTAQSFFSCFRAARAE